MYTLEDAIHRITQKSADILGLKDRGVLKEGMMADINVIDYENLCSQQPEYVNDFPHGGGRFVVKSQGYTATLVAGNVVVENCRTQAFAQERSFGNSREASVRSATRRQEPPSGYKPSTSSTPNV